jgi:hypothetical protein
VKPILKKVEGGSTFRKIAMGSWRTAGDPSVYGPIEIDMTRSLQHLQELQSQTSTKLTVSHLVGKAIAHVMHERLKSTV